MIFRSFSALSLSSCLATAWPRGPDNLRENTTPPSGWLLHAIATIITRYTHPGDRIVLLAAPLITHHPPTGMASTLRQSLTNPVTGLHDAARTVSRLLLEALRTGRHAIDLTTHRRYGELARANLTTAHRADARPEGRVLDDTPTNRDHLTGLAGKVDLILTTPRHHAPSLAHTRPPDPDSLGTLAKALVCCRPLLHPGGHVVITLPPRRRKLLDLTRRIMVAGHTAELLAIQRYVALFTESQGIRIITRASPPQRRTATRHQHHTGHSHRPPRRARLPDPRKRRAGRHRTHRDRYGH
jgi:hypothetical protein